MWRPAWDGFVRGFVLAYGIRAGLGTMTRALALARAGQYKDMRGWRLFSERGLQYRCALPHLQPALRCIHACPIAKYVCSSIYMHITSSVNSALPCSGCLPDNFPKTLMLKGSGQA